MEQKQNEIVKPVPYKVLMLMHSRFENHKRKHLKKHYKKEETSSIWFENDTNLKKFLNDILDTANQVSGIRVYLCEYEATTIPTGANPADYLDRLTIGLVPTKFNAGNGKHEDHPDAVGHRLFPVDPYNQGKICPPDICP